MGSNAQEVEHHADFDYVEGSPHLKHADLRARVEQNLRALITERVVATGACQVLEVGAGHGGFTSVLLGAGATVTITEMSKPSADSLKERFAGDQRVKIVYDPDAVWASETAERFDMVACLSVLHHIPDYIAFFESAAELTRDGGCFVSWQDPTWYKRRSAMTHRSEKAFYYLWRIGQGDLRRGLSTRIRRIRGIYDESNAADMSEYHVVRDGVDELLLEKHAKPLYEHVEIIRYWSTQSNLGQRVMSRRNLPTNFALVARGRVSAR